MSDPCVCCGDDATHKQYCRPCWKRETNPRKGPRSRGADWAERNPEAADMEAQRHRNRRLQGRTSGGRRL